MKIVLAPDSFKGNMKSKEVCEIASRAILEVMNDVEVVSVPMADGGEGTVDAIIAATGGRIVDVPVTGPLGEAVQGVIGLLPGDKTAIIEMASASGIELVPISKLNPMFTTTFGTGELILAAMDMGVQEIIMAVGGSATVDGGVGMALALGFQFDTADGSELHPGGGGLGSIVSIDTSNKDPRLENIRFRVACDVTNPLLGENGAAKIFGPQKGAIPQMVNDLESGLSNLADLCMKIGLLESVDNSGDGAAGGLGAGLRAFCNAEIVSGGRLVADTTGLGEHLKTADLVITGEGQTDAQTSGGKLCSVVADLARENHASVILVSGALDGDLASLLDTFDAAYSISPGAVSLDDALANARQNLHITVKSIARTLQLAQSR